MPSLPNLAFRNLEPFAKPLAVVAAIVLLGAPTAGAMMRKAPQTAAEASSAASGQVLKIELVTPPEPEVHPVYPMETFDTPPANEFKGGPGHGRAWRIGFDFELEPQVQEAEPPGRGELGAPDIAYEPPRFFPIDRPEERSSYEETVAGWLASPEPFPGE